MGYPVELTFQIKDKRADSCVERNFDQLSPGPAACRRKPGGGELDISGYHRDNEAKKKGMLPFESH